MKYFEFGQEHPELMVMLHGGGVCYRGALPVAEEMAKTYHVVLVAYDGFNPDEPETQFRSVPDEARRLGDYIVERYGGKIDILYGVSYGTFVLMDVLADKRLTITTTIADGMPTMDYADIKSPVLQNLYIRRARLFAAEGSGADAAAGPHSAGTCCGSVLLCRADGTGTPSPGSSADEPGGICVPCPAGGRACDFRVAPAKAVQADLWYACLPLHQGIPSGASSGGAGSQQEAYYRDRPARRI